jgi:DNA-binding Lrp family transcriptional regulator
MTFGYMEALLTRRTQFRSRCRIVSKAKENVKLLLEMIQNSRRSDRQLARALKVSQPTVTRKRAILEKEGYIKEYTLIPDLTKLEYDFVALTFLSFAEDKPELFDKAREWTKNQSSVLFAADGQGFGMNSIMVSAHKSYGDYSRLITRLREDWQPNLRKVESFIVSLGQKKRLIKDFSLRYLEKNETI